MAFTDKHIAGYTQVWIGYNIGTGANLAPLGITMNGAIFTVQDYTSPVHSDLRGGVEGSPVDVQKFGETGLVQLDLNLFDAVQMERVYRTMPDRSSKAGVQVVPGTCFFNFAYRLVLVGTGDGTGISAESVNFPLAFPSRERQVNKGAKFSTVSMSWECHAPVIGVKAGILYDDDFTGISI